MRRLLAPLFFATCVAELGAGEADWLTERDGVLELRLAHLEKRGPDGGTLRVDRRKRVLVWEGAPGEIGCKSPFEARFDDVKSVTVGENPGFVLELSKGRHKKLLLIPLPHVSWLLQEARVREGGMQTKLDSAGAMGSDGLPVRVGGAAGSVAPSVEREKLPEEVVSDTRKAVDSLLAALGRRQ